MNIAICGSGGMIGRALVNASPFHHWKVISRQQLYGDRQELRTEIEGSDAIVNLAGAPITARWTARNRKKIIESRQGINCILVNAVNQMERKPGIFLTASAIGIYDQTGKHSESAYSEGKGFLPQVIRQWEEPLDQLDLYVQAVKARIGNVLSNDGGVLVPFLRISEYGFLPVPGTGTQSFSFIHITDLISAINEIIDKKSRGVYNLCAPYPTDFATFTRFLAELRNVRLVFRVPKSILRLVMGESHSLITEGPFVQPGRLLKEGFKFEYPRIEEALINLVRLH
jgi:uncharacterized protein (TIGR01777 family)